MVVFQGKLSEILKKIYLVWEYDKNTKWYKYTFCGSFFKVIRSEIIKKRYLVLEYDKNTNFRDIFWL